MDGGHVLRAAGECRALLDSAADRDWRVRLPHLDFTVASAVTHMAEGTLWYATDLAAGPRRLDTMELRVPPETAPAELLVHTDDAARGLRLAFTPPTDLVGATLERLFPWAPADADPWPALLWANGRIDLPGHDRQVDWRWQCAPLEEWDGLNPAGRR